MQVTTISSFFSYNVMKSLLYQSWHNTGLNAFADDKINLTKKLKSVLGRVENIVGNRENALVTSIFSFSCNVLKKYSISGSLKVGIVW